MRCCIAHSATSLRVVRARSSSAAWATMETYASAADIAWVRASASDSGVVEVKAEALTGRVDDRACELHPADASRQRAATARYVMRSRDPEPWMTRAVRIASALTAILLFVPIYKKIGGKVRLLPPSPSTLAGGANLRSRPPRTRHITPRSCRASRQIS